MNLYDVLRYNIVPPIFLVFFTGSTQLLAISGRGEDITLLAVVSGVCGNVFSWCVVTAIILWAYIWLIITQKEYYGPVTSYGYTPVYKGRGIVYYLASLVGYLFCEMLHPGLSTLLYQNMPEILGSFNIVALLLCVYLFLQSSAMPPSDQDNLPWPYIFYRGRNLHPRILGVDVKQLTNCRIGLMAWQLLVLAFFIASVDRNGFNFPTFVCCFLQTFYLALFYYWERVYFHTLDMTLDRAGYYLCWGCLVWVPCFFTYNSYFHVAHVPVVSNSSSFWAAVVGFLAICGNWWTNMQKSRFRSSPDGRCVIWGSQATFIRAKYKDATGRERTSLLLTSGLWGVARHLNYTFEMIHSLAWTYPGLGLGLHPFLYPIFMFILLVHRVFRDEEKCRIKYGKYWTEYCRKVPYRFIPNVF